MVKASENVVVWNDTETGGLAKGTCPVLAWGLSVVDKGKVIDEIEVRFRPCPDDQVHDRALEVNGFTREQIQTFPEFSESIEVVRAFLDKYLHIVENQGGKFYIAGHNIISYDTPFTLAWLEKKCKKFNVNFDFHKYFDVVNQIDTKIISQKLVNWIPGNAPTKHSLEALTTFFGINHDQAHTALGDVRPNIKVYEAMCNYQQEVINSKAV